MGTARVEPISARTRYMPRSADAQLVPVSDTGLSSTSLAMASSNRIKYAVPTSRPIEPCPWSTN